MSELEPVKTFAGRLSFRRTISYAKVIDEVIARDAAVRADERARLKEGIRAALETMEEDVGSLDVAPLCRVVEILRALAEPPAAEETP